MSRRTWLSRYALTSSESAKPRTFACAASASRFSSSLTPSTRYVSPVASRVAPNVDHGLGEFAPCRGFQRVHRLGVAAVDEVGEGGRRCAREVEEELPHGFIPVPAPPGSEPLRRLGLGASRMKGRKFKGILAWPPCLKIDHGYRATHPDPLRAFPRRHRYRAGETAARHSGCGKAEAYRAREEAAEGARRGAGRALLRPPGPAGPRAGDRRHRVGLARDGALRTRAS